MCYFSYTTQADCFRYMTVLASLSKLLTVIINTFRFFAKYLPMTPAARILKLLHHYVFLLFRSNRLSMMEGIFSKNVKFTPEDILKHFKNVSLRAISIYSVTFGDYYIDGTVYHFSITLALFATVASLVFIFQTIKKIILDFNGQKCDACK